MESNQPHLVHRHRDTAKIRRQRNMAQMKNKDRIPEKELSNAEVANVSDAEFKTLMVRMFKTSLNTAKV